MGWIEIPDWDTLPKTTRRFVTVFWLMIGLAVLLIFAA